MSNVSSFVPLDNRISLAAQSPKNIPSLTQKLNKETINRYRQRMKVVVLGLHNEEVINGLFAQPPLARISFMRPVAENLVTGADGLIFGAATSPAGLACAAILPNSSIGPAWALTAPKKSIDPAAKPATILRDNIQFIIIPPPPT